IADLVASDTSNSFENPHHECDALIQGITLLSKPTTWNDHGGFGGIRAYPYSGALVVFHSQSMHREIANFLMAMRKARDKAQPMTVPPPPTPMPLRVFTLRAMAEEIKQPKLARNDESKEDNKRRSSRIDSDLAAFMQDLIGVITEEIAPKTWQTK